MTYVLLFRIAKGEIDSDCFKKWILSKDNVDFECSQTAFLTYFLNFIHEEISGSSHNFKESPLKFTPIKSKPFRSDGNERKRLNKSSSLVNKSLEKSFSEVSMEGNSSTPKMLKMHSNTEWNASFISQISPLYRNKPQFQSPFATSNDQKQNLSQKSPLCLGDIIVTRKSSKKKSFRCNGDSSEESTKRITPTSISQVKSSESFRRTLNSFANFNTTELSVESPIKTRSFLAAERLKILSRNTTDNAHSESRNCSKISQQIEIVPDLGSVTFKKQLDNLAAVYTILLDYNLVLNITSEIYFLISLLLTKKYSTDSMNGSPMGIDFLSAEDKDELNLSGSTVRECSDFFFSTHNVVYFSLRCLQSQVKVLKHYDKTTLKLLSLNERLRAFFPEFADHLNTFSEMKNERLLEITSHLPQTNVCFNLDTDNRENFPSCNSFQSFRKQRDLFYEILRIWEMNNMLDRWNFSIALGGRIRSLFGFDSTPANLLHFSRLFKAQLLSTSLTTKKEQGISEEQLPFLSSLPSIDKGKLDRLKNRLVEKNVSSGLNSAPQFEGCQAFYRDFIVEAGNHSFNRHLCDTFAFEIIELNNNKFGCDDLEESDNQTNSATRKNYTSALKNLIILAKFLGFVESLPYKSDTPNVPEYLLNSHIQVRSQSVPSFDVKQCLAASINQNTVVLTIPWIVKYLAMLDHVTLRLPYYISVYKLLFKLYRSFEGSDYNVALVKFSLGWLFELPHFPENEFFNFCDTAQVLEGRADAPDSTDVVDQNILYDCCPFLTKIKELLTSSSLHSTVTVKHITPVTTLESTESLLKRRSEHMLEEAFFNGQPASVRKTVEFVSERVASASVKHICNTIVPAFKKNASDELKTFLEHWINNCRVMSPTEARLQKEVQLRSQVAEVAHKQLCSLLDQCKTEVSAILSEKLPKSIDSLLAIDTLPQTKNACISISAKICKERIKQWINTHVTLSIFTKDYENEVQKTIGSDNKKLGKDKPVFALPPGGNKDCHNDRCLSGFHLLDKIKNISVEILENPNTVNEELVEAVVGDAFASFHHRCDVNYSIKSNICTLLVDFLLLLFIHKPELNITDNTFNMFVEVWKCCGKTKELFKNLLCQRNVLLISQSDNEKLTWLCYANFVAFILGKNILSFENFEEQCTGFMNKWDQVSVTKVRDYFIKELIKLVRNSGGDTNRLNSLL